MEYPKALQEVWKWKEEVYKDIKDLKGKEIVDFFNKKKKKQIGVRLK